MNSTFFFSLFVSFPIHTIKMFSLSFHYLCSIRSFWIEFLSFCWRVTHIHIYIGIDEHFVCLFLFFYPTSLFMCGYECLHWEKHIEKCLKIFLYVFAYFAKKNLVLLSSSVVYVCDSCICIKQKKDHFWIWKR